jgi:hypothetical protein
MTLTFTPKENHYNVNYTIGTASGNAIISKSLLHQFIIDAGLNVYEVPVFDGNYTDYESCTCDAATYLAENERTVIEMYVREEVAR